MDAVAGRAEGPLEGTCARGRALLITLGIVTVGVLHFVIPEPFVRIVQRSSLLRSPSST